MSTDEPEITVTKATGFMFATDGAIADGNALRTGLNEVLRRALDPNYVPPKPIKPPGPEANRLFVQLFAAAQAEIRSGESGLVGDLLALHKPRATVYPKADGMAPYVHWSCEGDEFGGYDGEAPDWPCETVAVIARHLGVEVTG